MLDLIIRNGQLVSPAGVRQADLGIQDGKIVAITSNLSDPTNIELDASGLHLFPGVIDTHVHFNEPGRSDWEGIATGSAALAAGGGTLFADMPLNSDPPLLSAADFHAKRAAAEASAVTDYAFWGGLTPANLANLHELAELGVIGFKAFMSNSGIANFTRADDLTLYRGMESAAALGLPVAVHAESEALTAALSREIRASGGSSFNDYLASRPVLAELEAIGRALLFAEQTGCDLHVVHVSSSQGIQLISEAKTKGIRVTAETCPHYLYFCEENLEQHGAALKCAPPVRSRREREALQSKLLEGEVDTIGSDHSPAPPALKSADDFFEVWGGIASVQTTLQTLLSCDVPLATIARLAAEQPAERFGLRHKGKLEPGYDADLCLVDLAASETLAANDLYYKHKYSPYIGQTLTGQIKYTLLRGRTVYKDGQHSATTGRFIRPERMP